RHASGRGALAGVEDDQQLHDPVAERRGERLDYEDILLADALVELDEDILVGKRHDGDVAHGEAQAIADRVGELGVAVAGEDAELVEPAAHRCSISCKPCAACVPRVCGAANGTPMALMEPHNARAVKSSFGRS